MKRLPRLDLRGRWFVDETGRRVILRGVNLGGDCKVPYPHGGSNHPSGFADHREVSFIGRPFPLAECDEHLQRLAHWGFNAVRLLTTWEAVEHAGPGRYDETYLDYFAEVCRRCGEHGLYVFVDFHQDVWSRMSGGDGAPGWTFEAVGLDFTRFHAADAAHLMQAKYDYARGGRQDEYPQMSWASNYRLPANMIMWTLFFGGRDFTPRFAVDGRNVQDYLQDHYLGAMRQVALRVQPLLHVIGFDTLNEPGEGMIGATLDYRHEASTPEHPAPVRVGLALSSLDALLMARGVTRELPRYARDASGKMIKVGAAIGNARRVPIWREGAHCPFETAGAYRLVDGRAQVLRNDHFTQVDGREIDLEKSYMLPFFHRVAKTVRAVRADWLLFAEMNPYKAFAGKSFPLDMPERCVNASHWYDVTVLRTKTFPYADAIDTEAAVPGPAAGAVLDRYVKEMATVARAGETLGPDGAPTLIGECGIPFDLDGGAAYEAWRQGDRSSAPWAQHIVAQTLMYDALDRLLLSSTQWNYTASNRNDLACGDGWNQEDLSIFSRDQHDSNAGFDSGGRAIAGFSRPYARCIAGEPICVSFDAGSGEFLLEYDADPRASLPTEIFLPPVHYPVGYTIDAPTCELRRSSDGSRVWITAQAGGRTRVAIRRIC
jgi:hypothetical protein